MPILVGVPLQQVEKVPIQQVAEPTENSPCNRWQNQTEMFLPVLAEALADPEVYNVEKYKGGSFGVAFPPIYFLVWMQLFCMGLIPAVLTAVGAGKAVVAK